MSAIEESGLRDFITQRVLDQVGKVRVAPLAAELLTAFTEDRRHQKLFDGLIGALGKFLNDEAALDAMREKIRDELPSLFNLFRADAYLMKKIVTSAATLFDEVLADQTIRCATSSTASPSASSSSCATSPEYAERAEELKRDLLARPELARLADNMWKGLREFLEQDAAPENSAIRRQLAGTVRRCRPTACGRPETSAPT